MPPTSLRIDLKPSTTLTGALVVLHLAAGAAVTCLAWPLPINAALAMVLCIHGFWLYQRYAALTSADAIHTLICTTNGTWFVAQGRRRAEVALSQDSVVHPWLIALVVKTRAGDRLQLPILPDMVEGDDHRRLRAHLLRKQTHW